MDLSFGVYGDIPVLLGSFRLSSHKKVRISCDFSVNTAPPPPPKKKKTKKNKKKKKKEKKKTFKKKN